MIMHAWKVEFLNHIIYKKKIIRITDKQLFSMDQTENFPRISLKESFLNLYSVASF